MMIINVLIRHRYFSAIDNLGPILNHPGVTGAACILNLKVP